MVDVVIVGVVVLLEVVELVVVGEFVVVVVVVLVIVVDVVVVVVVVLLVVVKVVAVGEFVVVFLVVAADVVVVGVAVFVVVEIVTSHSSGFSLTKNIKPYSDYWLDSKLIPTLLKISELVQSSHYLRSGILHSILHGGPTFDPVESGTLMESRDASGLPLLF